MPVQENIQELFKVKGCVYMATSPSGKKYVGMTKNFRNRYKSHKCLAENNDRAFCRAIKKYGWDNLKWEILFESNDMDKLMEQEIHFINKYNTRKFGYNMNDGGLGNGNMSRESILKYNLSRGRKPINVFELPSLEFYKTYEIQSDCVEELGISRHAITECLSNQKGNSSKPRSKRAGNYYITTDSVDYVNENREDILSYLYTLQVKDRSVYATRKNKPWTIEQRDSIAFGQTGKRYLMSYLFGSKTEIHSNLAVIGEIIGVTAETIRWGLSKRNPFIIDEFKIVQI